MRKRNLKNDAERDARIGTVRYCKARIERKLAMWPDHPKADGWRKRLAEYDRALKSYDLIALKKENA